MSPTDICLLAAAGLLGGTVNTVVGGATMVTFPALLAAGVPALTANVTNMIGLLPGMANSTFIYRRELREQRSRIRTLAGSAVFGAGCGCVLLLTTSQELFEAIVPALVIFASLLMLVQPRLAALFQRRTADAGVRQRLVLHTMVVLAGVYITYFGAAGGVLLLAFLGIGLSDGMQRLNALRNLLALLMVFIAACCYILLAPIDWLGALVLAVTTTVGAHLGGLFARQLADRVLRWIAVLLGLVVATTLLV